jgi:hypothetical protein
LIMAASNIIAGTIAFLMMACCFVTFTATDPKRKEFMPLPVYQRLAQAAVGATAMLRGFHCFWAMSQHAIPPTSWLTCFFWAILLWYFAATTFWAMRRRLPPGFWRRVNAMGMQDVDALTKGPE